MAGGQIFIFASLPPPYHPPPHGIRVSDPRPIESVRRRTVRRVEKRIRRPRVEGAVKRAREWPTTWVLSTLPGDSETALASDRSVSCGPPSCAVWLFFYALTVSSFTSFYVCRLFTSLWRGSCRQRSSNAASE